jgi:hypothetical protein
LPPAGEEAGSPESVVKVEAAIRRHLRAGNGILKVAALVGCGSGTVQRAKREMVRSVGNGMTPAASSESTRSGLPARLVGGIVAQPKPQVLDCISLTCSKGWRSAPITAGRCGSGRGILDAP